MINDEYVSKVMEEVGKDLLGAENVQELHKSLGAEDFGSFMAYPGRNVHNRRTEEWS